MDIHIKVDASEIRPPFTGADWWFSENGDLQVRVAKLSSEKRELLLAVHETLEAILCHFDGVTHEMVDVFDSEYDRTHASDLNAGDDPLAPYARQHSFATATERMMAAYWNENWLEYDKELEAIPSLQEKTL